MCDTTTQNAAYCAICIELSSIQWNLASLIGTRDHKPSTPPLPTAPAITCSNCTYPVLKAGSPPELPQYIIMYLTQSQGTSPTPANCGCVNFYTSCTSQCCYSSVARIQILRQQSLMMFWCSHSRSHSNVVLFLSLRDFTQNYEGLLFLTPKGHIRYICPLTYSTSQTLSAIISWFTMLQFFSLLS